MPHLKVSLLALVSLWPTIGCSTSSYQVINQVDGRVEINTTPDRVLLECELSSESKEIPYGFMIHILDQEKTVMTVAQMNTLTEEECDERLREIGKIIKNGKIIYAAGDGDFDKPRELTEYQYTFPKHGTFHGNGHFLQFHAIMNEKGECYSAHQRKIPPCPRPYFPIENHRNGYIGEIQPAIPKKWRTPR